MFYNSWKITFEADDEIDSMDSSNKAGVADNYHL